MNERIEKRSFEHVNYMFRPKKQIERKIIIEILQALKKKIPLNNYLYIGFGSIYYYYFVLFHIMLKIDNLRSIDSKSTINRFKFNRPYDFISFENKISTDFLSGYKWKQSTALWLDYDNDLNDIVLSDLKIIAKNYRKRDILMITLDARCEEDESDREQARKDFYNDFGDYVSRQYRNKKYYTPKNLPLLLQDVVMNYLMTMSEYQDAGFHKLFSFRYKDGAPMFTMGGILCDNNDELRNRDWGNSFISTNEEITDIDVPILTYCEKFYIDSHIEDLKREIEEIEDETAGDDSSLKEQKKTDKMNKEVLPFELRSFHDLKNYIKYYRYYPQYYEGIL